MLKPEGEDSDDGEITSEVKANRSRKNLNAIKLEASQKSLKVPPARSPLISARRSRPTHLHIMFVYYQLMHSIVLIAVTLMCIDPQNLLKPKPEAAGAHAQKSKSRFELMTEEDIRSIKADEAQEATASVKKSKSFFGDEMEDPDKPDKKSFLSGVSRKMGKKNKVAAEVM